MKTNDLKSRRPPDFPVVFEAIGILLFGIATILTTQDWVVLLLGIIILILAGFFLYGGLILDRETC